MSRRRERGRERFELTVCRWPKPAAIFAPAVQRFDEVVGRLPRSLAARASGGRGDLNLIAGRLRRELLDQRLKALTEQLSGLWRLAELAHPDKPLSRGFARVTSREGVTLTRSADARAAHRLTLHFGDGPIDASVDERRAAAAVERKPRKPYISPQPGLFDAGEE